MLPLAVADAVIAARQSDARRRAEQARLIKIARAQAARRATPTVPTQRRRRFRWFRRPIIRPV
ncbi:MAG TPA: hypothetical protein VIG48_00840 [Jatrophihabitans sp.]|jgi:hypothetical protein